MSVKDYFRPVATMTAEGVREYLSRKSHDKYNLVDVRQPQEYAAGHLPGAQLIPVGELPARVGELDPNKPTVAY